MLISEQQKILFVHIQKTGGSSIREALRGAVPDLRPFLGTHDHAAWARLHLGPRWADYFKFAFVRNPWDRLVSWYAMIREQGRRGYANRLWQYVLTHSSSFEEFLHRCTDTIEDHDGRKFFLYNQLDYVSGEESELLVDFVGRYESLEQDARAVFDRLGLPGLRLPHVNRSGHDHYSTCYTDATRQLVADRFARDIAFFGYTFEAEALRQSTSQLSSGDVSV
jgi:chondroitin 4-sulfotransferase 11